MNVNKKDGKPWGWIQLAWDRDKWRAVVKSLT